MAPHFASWALLPSKAGYVAVIGSLLRTLRVVVLGRAQHDAAVDRERLQDDVVTFPVLVGKGGTDREPEVDGC